MTNTDAKPCELIEILRDPAFGLGIVHVLTGYPLDSEREGFSYERGRLFAAAFPDLALAAIERRIGIVAMANMAAERDANAVVAVFYV